MGRLRQSAVSPFAFAAAVLAWPAAVSAQASPGLPGPQQLNPAGQVSARPQQRHDLLEAPGPGACPLAASELTFRLASVELRGLKALTAAELAPAYAGDVGHDVRMASLCEIRDRVAALIFHKGILARVDIPPQHITDGRLVLQVTEARIASVRVVGDAGPARSKVEDYIDHLRGMSPFDLRAAQRWLLLAADVPGVRLSASLSASSQGDGAVDLIVRVSRQPVDVVVNVTNYSSKELGPWGGLARVDINGLTGLGERTSLVAYSSLFDDRQQVIQLVEEARLGSDGLIGRVSLALGRDHPGAELAALDLRGTSFVGSAELAYPVIRSRRENLNVTGGLDVIDQKTRLGGGPTLNDDHLRVVYLKLDGDIRPQIGLGSDIAAALEVRQGLNALGASKTGAFDLSRIGGHPDATVVRGDARWAVQWAPKFATLVSMQAQWANEPVLSYEELQVGNLTIGRGYDPSSVAGDRGVGASFEARIGPFRLTPWADVQLYGFYDAVYVKNLVDSPDFTRTVTSAGGGLKFGLASRFSLDVMYACPFDRISALAPKRPPGRVLVSLVARFP